MAAEELFATVAVLVLVIFWLGRWPLFHRVFAVDPRRTQSERVITVVTGYRPTAGALLKILAFFAYPLTSLTVTRRKERTDPPFAATMGPVAYTLCSALFLNVTLLEPNRRAPRRLLASAHSPSRSAVVSVLVNRAARLRGDVQLDGTPS